MLFGFSGFGEQTAIPVPIQAPQSQCLVTKGMLWDVDRSQCVQCASGWGYDFNSGLCKNLSATDVSVDTPPADVVQVLPVKSTITPTTLLLGALVIGAGIFAYTSFKRR